MDLTPDKNGVIDGQMIIQSLIGNKIPKFIKTNTYSIFKLNAHYVSRLTSKHIEDLSKSMKENGWTEHSVVVVNKDFEVVDGTYRVIAAIKTNTPITYTVSDAVESPRTHLFDI